MAPTPASWKNTDGRNKASLWSIKCCELAKNADKDGPPRKRCGRSWERTRARVVLCTRRIMRSVSRTLHYLSQMTLVILRRWIKSSTPFVSHSTVTSTVTLPTQWQAGCDAEGDPAQASGSLLKHPRRARKAGVEGQDSSSPELQGSPAKEQPMATPGSAQVGDMIANLSVRNNCVISHFIPAH